MIKRSTLQDTAMWKILPINGMPEEIVHGATLDCQKNIVGGAMGIGNTVQQIPIKHTISKVHKYK